MSFLFPFFFAAAAAIAAPIILHLLRQRARHVQAFSSLMFLRPSPPRMQPKTRVENLLLLLLRCAALILLAIAFSRPLWNTEELITAGHGGRTVILVDTSASMSRDGLWDQALKRVDSVLNRASEHERFAIMTYDRGVRHIVSFENWVTTPAANRAAFSLNKITHTPLSHAGTDIGAALVSAVELITEDETATLDAKVPKHIVVISDMQAGRRLDALRNTTWPEELTVSIEQVNTTKTTNAGMALVAPAQGLAPDADDKRQRIRVTNDAKSINQNFSLAWSDGVGTPTTVTVPPGSSRIVRAPARLSGQPGTSLILSGDDHNFDNTLYIAEDAPADAPVLFIGNEKIDDPNGLPYFLKHALQPTRVLAPRLITAIEPAALSSLRWVVVSGAPATSMNDTLQKYVSAGGAMMVVLRAPTDVDWLAQFTGRNLTGSEAQLNGYAMLGRVDYEHPLLRPFDIAQFGDFTKIHVWHYRKVTLPSDATVLAWYDDGNPAWFECTVGKGRVLVMTSGWHPADSQLALSTKFVPLIYTELQRCGPSTQRSTALIIGEPYEYAANSTALIGPLSSAEIMAKRQAAPATTNPDTEKTTPASVVPVEKPGLYELKSASGSVLLAANIDPGESLIAPLALESLEALGVKITQQNITAGSAISDAHMAQRQLQIAELESQQKSWAWVLAAVLVLLIIETSVAGQATGKLKQQDDVSAGVTA